MTAAIVLQIVHCLFMAALCVAFIIVAPFWQLGGFGVTANICLIAAGVFCLLFGQGLRNAQTMIDLSR